MEQATLRIAEVADMLGLGRSTVREMVRDGVLTSTRVGRFILIPKDGVDRWIASKIGEKDK